MAMAALAARVGIATWKAGVGRQRRGRCCRCCCCCCCGCGCGCDGVVGSSSRMAYMDLCPCSMAASAATVTTGGPVPPVWTVWSNGYQRGAVGCLLWFIWHK